MVTESPQFNYGQVPEIPPGFNVQEVFVAGNRGTCGGVEMTLAAVSQIMEVVPQEIPIYATNTPINFPQAFERYGDRLKIAGGNISDVPDGSILIVSAHGAPPSLFDEAKSKNLHVIDVTCPIVTEEQKLVRNTAAKGIPIVYLGEENHPETIGIKGQVPKGAIKVFDPNEPIPEDEHIPDGAKLFVKTTNDPARNELRANELKERVGELDDTRILPCYALKNRYAAGKPLIEGVDLWMVVGDISSNNARGLRDIEVKGPAGEGKLIPRMLVGKPQDIDWEMFTPSVRKVGVTAAASAPEEFTQRILNEFRRLGVNVIELPQVLPEMPRTFRLPKEQLEALRQKYAD